METTLSLPKELQIALEEIARRTGRDRSATLVEAVRDYVARQERPRPRSIGIVTEAPAQSDEIEEWLAAHSRPKNDWGRAADGAEEPPPSDSRGEGTQDLAGEQPRRRLRSLAFVADEVRLHAKDIDAYLAANWRPEADWRDEPES